MRKIAFGLLTALSVGAASEGRSSAEGLPAPPVPPITQLPDIPAPPAPPALPALPELPKAPVLPAPTVTQVPSDAPEPPVPPAPAANQAPPELPDLLTGYLPAPAPVAGPALMLPPHGAPMNLAPPMPPSESGSFGALQDLAGCPCPEGKPAPEAPPTPPPYGGPLHERQKLFGDWFGHRGHLREHGYTFDIYSTNIPIDVANGGRQETLQQRGRMDFLMNVNGEKAGLWKGSFIDLHAEMAYGTGIGGPAGTFSPTSIAQILPTPNGYVFALTGVKFTQALSERFLVFGGKINILDGFNQPFTGGARGVDGFLNGGLLFPLTYARSVPYSSWGGGFAYLKGVEPVFTFIALDANNTPTRDGFDTFFDNGVSMIALLNIPTKFFGLPGHQGFGGSYSTKRYTIIDRTSFINAIVLNQALPTKAGSWSMAYSFDQALYVDPENPKRSWGVFGNAGLADQNPSPFRYSFNIGIGGSSPIACRKFDTFGIGYYALGITTALQNLAPRLLPIRDNEQGVELFYNYAASPWFHITPDVQFVMPGFGNANWLTALGLRAKVDF